MNKKQNLKSLFLFISLLYTTIISNEYPAIITKPSYTSNPPISNPPTLAKAQQRAHAILRDNHHTPQSHPAHYPTQDQFNIVLSWMSQLYPSTTACTPTPQPVSLAKTRKGLWQTYDYINIINTRNNAIEQLNNGNSSITTQTYVLSPVINDYCNAYEINIEALQSCTGNIVQQILHREFIEITKHSATIWNNKEYKQISDQFSSTFADFTDAGIAFNHEKNIDQAINLADACWAIFDCIKAVGEGMIQGICTTIDDIIHPVRTAQNILDSVATCGYCIGILTLEIGELGYIMLAEHPDNTYKKLHIWANNFEIINKALQEKCATLKTRDIIKEAVAFGTQCYATTKALRGMSILFKNAHKHTLKIVQQISHPTKSTALTTPEGLVFRIADSSVEYMKSAQPLTNHKFPKVANMAEFFELPFGKTCLKNSQKTKRLFQKYSSIYKITQDIPGTTLKEGYTYYLDRFHGDHIEVFNKKLKVAGVYNLDGTFNTSKFEAAKKSGRNIKNLMR